MAYNSYRGGGAWPLSPPPPLPSIGICVCFLSWKREEGERKEAARTISRNPQSLVLYIFRVIHDPPPQCVDSCYASSWGRWFRAQCLSQRVSGLDIRGASSCLKPKAQNGHDTTSLKIKLSSHKRKKKIVKDTVRKQFGKVANVGHKYLYQPWDFGVIKLIRNLLII